MPISLRRCLFLVLINFALLVLFFNMDAKNFLEAVCPSAKCSARRQSGSSSSAQLERLVPLETSSFIYSCESCGNRCYFCNLNGQDSCAVNPSRIISFFRRHMESRHNVQLDEDLAIIRGAMDDELESERQSDASGDCNSEMGTASMADDDEEDGDFNDDDDFDVSDAFLFAGVTPLPLPAIGSYRQESLPVFPAPIRPGGPVSVEQMDISALLDELIATGLISKLPHYVFWENGRINKQTVESYNLLFDDVLGEEHPELMDQLRYTHADMIAIRKILGKFTGLEVLQGDPDIIYFSIRSKIVQLLSDPATAALLHFEAEIPPEGRRSELHHSRLYQDIVRQTPLDGVAFPYSIYADDFQAFDKVSYSVTAVYMTPRCMKASALRKLTNRFVLAYIEQDQLDAVMQRVVQESISMLDGIAVRNSHFEHQYMRLYPFLLFTEADMLQANKWLHLKSPSSNCPDFVCFVEKKNMKTFLHEVDRESVEPPWHFRTNETMQAVYDAISNPTLSKTRREEFRKGYGIKKAEKPLTSAIPGYDPWVQQMIDFFHNQHSNGLVAIEIGSFVKSLNVRDTAIFFAAQADFPYEKFRLHRPRNPSQLGHYSGSEMEIESFVSTLYIQRTAYDEGKVMSMMCHSYSSQIYMRDSIRDEELDIAEQYCLAWQSLSKDEFPKDFDSRPKHHQATHLRRQAGLTGPLKLTNLKTMESKHIIARQSVDVGNGKELAKRMGEREAAQQALRMLIRYSQVYGTQAHQESARKPLERAIKASRRYPSMIIDSGLEESEYDPLYEETLEIGDEEQAAVEDAPNNPHSEDPVDFADSLPPNVVPFLGRLYSSLEALQHRPGFEHCALAAAAVHSRLPGADPRWAIPIDVEITDLPVGFISKSQEASRILLSRWKNTRRQRTEIEMVRYGEKLIRKDRQCAVFVRQQDHAFTPFTPHVHPTEVAIPSIVVGFCRLRVRIPDTTRCAQFFLQMLETPLPKPLWQDPWCPSVFSFAFEVGWDAFDPLAWSENGPISRASIAALAARHNILFTPQCDMIGPCIIHRTLHLLGAQVTVCPWTWQCQHPEFRIHLTTPSSRLNAEPE